ncbi:hypothetical protein DY000_02038381 [Brassica cretica]|uniref:Uncharacterized protein n=1 Tax=Brassica cretica TaxID=69181 RepID=A0ABQ7BJT4_BRACR|nr:hypothetical protein DY000_02038381 [Brassica cretica]
MHGLMSYRRFRRARTLRIDQAERMLGRYVATELGSSLVTTERPSGMDAWSLRSDQAWLELGRYVATERNGRSDRTACMWLALDRGYIKSHSASLDDPFNPSQFQKCRLPSQIISNTQLKCSIPKMFGLHKKSSQASKLQQDVYYPFKTDAWSLRSDQAWLELGRYVATERNGRSDRTACMYGSCVMTELGLSLIRTKLYLGNIRCDVFLTVQDLLRKDILVFCGDLDVNFVVTVFDPNSAGRPRPWATRPWCWSSSPMGGATVVLVVLARGQGEQVRTVRFSGLDLSLFVPIFPEIFVHKYLYSSDLSFEKNLLK